MTGITRNVSNGNCEIELIIRAEPDYLTVARAAVAQVAESAGFGKKDVNDISLAVVEAITNVIRHGYGGPCRKPIILTINKLPLPSARETKTQGMEIIIRDFGKQINPAIIKGRDLKDVKPGGLGVHIIRTVMDEVNYSNVPQEGGMELHMVKYTHRIESSRSRGMESSC